MKIDFRAIKFLPGINEWYIKMSRVEFTIDSLVLQYWRSWINLSCEFERIRMFSSCVLVFTMVKKFKLWIKDALVEFHLILIYLRFVRVWYVTCISLVFFVIRATCALFVCCIHTFILHVREYVVLHLIFAVGILKGKVKERKKDRNLRSVATVNNAERQ